MQASLEEKLNPDHGLFTEAEISEDFYKYLKLNEDSQIDDLRLEEYGAIDNLSDGEEEEEEEEEDEFSFVCGEENKSPIAAEDVFSNGQIKTVFPLFNRDLLFSGGDLDSLHENLPTKPPVKKVFVETNEENVQVTSSIPENDEISGPYCEWSSRKAVEASPEVCKKSNSTGFSKIWRLKELTARCNSDGRDAFVFLNSSHAPSTAKQQASATGKEKNEKMESTVKISGKVKKTGKSKTASLSAHEVYLKSKAKDEQRRPSYLPYRPELMGFFTNVNGGLTRNVHPF